VTTAERLDRLEQATAELTLAVRGDVRSGTAVGAILAERRTAEREAAEREAKVRAELDAEREAEVQARLAADGRAA
jgi:hypothetical protein